MPVYKEIKTILDGGSPAFEVIILSSETDPSLNGKKLVFSGGRIPYSEVDLQSASKIQKLVELKLSPGELPKTGCIEDYSKKLQLFIKRFLPRPRLIILGGGHVGASVCRIAAHLDYEIIIADDRPSFAAKRAHPDADQVFCDRFELVLDKLSPSPSDYIIIVTRGHKHDRLCLEKALQRESAYIGMIGSKRRVKAQFKDLVQSGFTEEQLSGVYAPIGLSIGAVSESEIALSILAEITKVRRGISRDESLQGEVLNALEDLEETDSQAVLATIISARGSTPRKTGAQMIVYPDGSLLGTIGGGCAETQVRQEALYCFEHGRTGQMKIELTADAAADEGMACGGTMEIYLEQLPGISPEIIF